MISLFRKYKMLAGLGFTFHYYKMSQLDLVSETCMLLKTLLNEISERLFFTGEGKIKKVNITVVWNGEIILLHIQKE